MELEELYLKARRAAENSYSPYSKFRVGAALLCGDGSVVTGANVENRSFGLTICAERGAITAAVSSGRRKFLALAISTPDAEYPVCLCGACRQFLSEFADPALPIAFGHGDSIGARTTMGELLPLDSLHELAEQ